MHALCTAWQSQVKEFLCGLHGHQSKTLALFVEGAIAANSIVVQRVADALLPGSEASACSIERRLERFLSNERIETEQTWDDFLSQIMPFFRRAPMRLVIDLTAYKEHAEDHLHRTAATIARVATGVESHARPNEVGSRIVVMS